MPYFLRSFFTTIKQILKDSKKKLSQLDNERLAIIIVLILGLGLLLLLLILAPDLLESEWFLELLRVPATYGGFIANGAYIGRLCNLLTARPYHDNGGHNRTEKTRVITLLNQEIVLRWRIGPKEKKLTPMGISLGIVLAILCIVFHMAVPFLGIFSYFAYILFILGYACVAGGLFNRIGSSLDGTRLPQEKKAILGGVFLGLSVALSLVVVLMVTGALPFVAVAGISQVFFDLFVLHKALFAVSFTVTITSLSASFFDYCTKAYCFLSYCLGCHDPVLKERVESRIHEYRGAFLGLGVGCLLSLGIITGLILTGGFIATPVAVAATIFVIIVLCNSVFSALFSRVGRVIDGINRVDKIPEQRDTTETNSVSVHHVAEAAVSLVAPTVILEQESSLVPRTAWKEAEDIPPFIKDKKNREHLSTLKRIQSCPTFFIFSNREAAPPKEEKKCDSCRISPTFV